MSVTIRLRRIGRKKQPSYRMVVTDKSAPRDGAYLDVVGFYNPRQRPAELRVDLEKVDRWVGQGALMSDTAASLVRKARNGGDRSVKLVPMGVDTAALSRPAEASAEAPTAESAAESAAPAVEPAEAAAEPAEAVAEPAEPAAEPAEAERPVIAEAAEEVVEAAAGAESAGDAPEEEGTPEA